MSTGALVLRGVVRGNTIELERAPGLVEGQSVSVTIHVPAPLPEGLLRAFGAWADEADAVDEFVRENYRLRELEARVGLDS